MPVRGDAAEDHGGTYVQGVVSLQDLPEAAGSVAHNLAFKPDQVHVEKKSVPWIEYKTSEKLTRHSCSTCAVTMMNVLEGEKACVAIPAGSIDREGGPNDAFFLPQHQIYFGDRICDTPADVPKWSGFMGSSEKLA
eukprot:CAMPEP_0206148196 /NCGR_PEP_ID=MMETSP1473-20131121/35881_1 /ASSEMBLY_ACC=CAM_ASM_001109 /TAXON_ID=1461547 /ORGANISM="Stichococcus sp, Strain RCC1054" /LENGTH=135 /DNA_ID=CAMNT_0053545447 /DNA_START=123 /DNA_END=531 /DNA_ORIENTATION=+